MDKLWANSDANRDLEASKQTIKQVLIGLGIIAGGGIVLGIDHKRRKNRGKND